MENATIAIRGHLINLKKHMWQHENVYSINLKTPVVTFWEGGIIIIATKHGISNIGRRIGFNFLFMTSDFLV